VANPLSQKQKSKLIGKPGISMKIIRLEEPGRLALLSTEGPPPPASIQPRGSAGTRSPHCCLRNRHPRLQWQATFLSTTLESSVTSLGAELLAEVLPTGGDINVAKGLVNEQNMTSVQELSITNSGRPSFAGIRECKTNRRRKFRRPHSPRFEMLSLKQRKARLPV
jgi:hypothetical protein